MKLPVIPARVAAGPRSLSVSGLLLGLWDSLAIYLPLVLMGLLALLTYWMVRHTPALNAAQEPRPQVHEVDFYMRGVTVKTYDMDGRLQTQLSGAEMRHYSGNDSVEMDLPRLRSMSDGRVTQASAQRARSSDDGSEVQLFGDAVVVREAFSPARGIALPRQEYRSDFLHIFSKDERVISHLPVRFSSGGDEFSADSFRYNHLDRVLELEGRATARLVPRVASASASKSGR